jgi:hypothetical protein
MGSWNNLDADFGSWILDAGFCIIGLHRLDSISAAGIGLVAISLRALDKQTADFGISIASTADKLHG